MTWPERGECGLERCLYEWNKVEIKKCCAEPEGLTEEENKAPEAVHSTLKKGTGTQEKVLCFAQKGTQAECLGAMSWMIGSMEKPCMSHRNCSGDMERRSEEDLGQEKEPQSTRL